MNGERMVCNALLVEKMVVQVSETAECTKLQLYEE